MEDYELVLVFPPKQEKAEEDILGSIEKTVTTGKGKITKKDAWGKKSLAYPILKHTEGVYHYMEISMSPSEAPRLERRIKTEEIVLRYLLVRK
jgi:small subunit ribosomal protein S6